MKKVLSSIMVLVMVSLISLSVAGIGSAEVDGAKGIEWISVRRIVESFPPETVTFNLRIFEDEGEVFASDLHVKVGDTSFCLGEKWIYYLDRTVSKKEKLIAALGMDSYQIGVVKVYEYTFNDINEAEKLWIRRSDMDVLMG